MAFDVNVLFTGIVGFAKHSNGYRVLVPNTLQGAWENGSYVPAPASGHYPYGRSHPKKTHFPILEGDSFKWALDRHHVSIVPEFTNGPPGLTGSMDDLTSMQEIWGHANPKPFDTSPLDPAVLSSPSSHPDRCCVYCDITVGAVQGRFLNTWSMPGQITNQKGGQDPYSNACLAWAVQWTLSGLASLTVSATPYSSNAAGTQFDEVVSAADGSIVNLIFGNFCDEPWRSPGPIGPRSDDPDFVWHYELFRQDEQWSAELQARADRKTLPFLFVGRSSCVDSSTGPARDQFPHLRDMPVRLQGGAPTPSGQNCMPARWW